MGSISDDQARLLEQFCRQSPEGKLHFASQSGGDLAATLFQVLNNVSALQTTQYVLAQLDELLNAQSSLVSLFLDLRRTSPDLPLGLLSRLSGAQDLYTSFMATKLLAKFIANASWEIDPMISKNIFNWFKDIAESRQGSDDLLLAAFTALQEFLRSDFHREIFVENDGLNLLSAILNEHKTEHQILYLGIYCAWLLSFNSKVASEEFARTPIIETIVSTLRTVATDKVIRVAIGTIRNLVDKADNNDVILQCGFSKILTGLLARRWGDEDVASDLGKIDEALQKNIAKMSSFDAYNAEIVSGDLCWSPCHKSEKFWRENATRFEENKCRVLGLLVQVIKEGRDRDPLPLAVALHDIGEFARFHPRGRAIINNTAGLKQLITDLLGYHEPSVASQALLCCQKILVHNWEFLG